MSLLSVGCGSDEEPSGDAKQDAGDKQGTGDETGDETGKDAGEEAGKETGDTLRYRGLVAGGDFTGVLDVTVVTGGGQKAKAQPKAATGSVSGTLTDAEGGAPIALSGSWDPTSGMLALSGEGFTFTGTGDGLAISGTYTGPAGAGAFSLLASSTEQVALFCGSFSGEGQGTWNVAAVEGGAASGAFSSADGETSGTFMGTWLNGELSLGTVGLNARGSLSETGGNGTWMAGNGKEGTWTGSPCGGEDPGDAGTGDAAAPDSGTN